MRQGINKTKDIIYFITLYYTTVCSFRLEKNSLKYDIQQISQN